MASFTNNNTRIFYATQAVAVGKIGASAVDDSSNDGTEITDGACAIMHGVQSVGIDTNFNLEQAFELGQLSLYENIEDIPDISVSINRFLDGYSLGYHLGASYDGNGVSVSGATATTLAGRADTRADFRAVINSTTDAAVTSGDAAVAELYCSGMYLSSVSYAIPTDGTATEDVAFVGNNKRWLTDDGESELLLINGSNGVNSAFASIFGDDSPATPHGGVMRRQDVLTGTNNINGFTTQLPTIIQGITADSASGIAGTRNAQNAGPVDTNLVHVQSFNCSVDLGREAINQLGTRTPYSRYVNFPTEVTSSLEVIATAGDNVSAVETTRNNLSNHEICVALNDSTVIHLGKKNKISSVTYGGGDAGGGNASITYNFSNFNDFVVLHSGDPIIDTNSATYWTDQFSG